MEAGTRGSARREVPTAKQLSSWSSAGMGHLGLVLAAGFFQVFIQNGNVAQDCVLAPDSLSHLWPGEESAVDVVGENDGILLPGVAFSTGMVGSGFQLDGSGHVEVADAPELRLSSDTPSSLDAWVYPTQFAPGLYAPLTVTKPYYFGLLYSPERRHIRGHVHDGSHWIFADGPYVLPLNQWTHVAQTWDGRILNIYANGELIGSGAIDGLPDPREEGPLLIGRWWAPVPRQENFPFIGIIDEATIYRRALASSEMSAIFAAGSAGVCRGRLPSAELVQTSPHCATVVLSSGLPFFGGEIGLAYDPETLIPRRVRPGRDLPVGAQLFFEADAAVSCSPEARVQAGLTVGWIHSLSAKQALPAGTHELLVICFDGAPGAGIGDCSPLRFVPCLGVPEGPVRNIVTLDENQSTAVLTEDGELCLMPEQPYRRGDANHDAAFDISDAITILGCLFLGDECSACSDSMDANDDGQIDIADPAYLLNWRFFGGLAPPAPFPDCGPDPTSDELAECGGATSC